MPVDKGGVVDIGHCFEWAFLLSDWYLLTDEESSCKTASVS